MAAADLIARHPAEWRAAVGHPFLAAIRDGKVPVGAFERWLRQDHLFVADLLAFQAGLLAAAPRRAQAVLAAGLVALEAELGWFEELLGAGGADLPTSRASATEAYARQLKRLLDAPFEVAATALWTLERVYLEAWRGAAPGAAPYRGFVEHWTVPEFAAYVDDLELLAASTPAADAAFLEILDLEVAFWDLAWKP